MSSCAASSCTCCPKASSASATLASSPTGGAPLSCRFACNSSAQYRHRRPNQKPPRSRNPAHFGSVPSVAAAWWSSRDLPRPSSNSVLHPFSSEPPHETTIPVPPPTLEQSSFQCSFRVELGDFTSDLLRHLRTLYADRKSTRLNSSHL